MVDPELERRKALARGASRSQAEAVAAAAFHANERWLRGGDAGPDPDLEMAKALADGASHQEAYAVLHAASHARSPSTGKHSSGPIFGWLVFSLFATMWIHDSVLGRDINECESTYRRAQPECQESFSRGCDDVMEPRRRYCNDRDISLWVFGFVFLSPLTVPLVRIMRRRNSP